MTDYVIIGGFIKKICKQLFLENLMKMMILREKQSYVEGGYKSKKLIIFL